MPAAGGDLGDQVLDPAEAQPLRPGHRQHVAEPVLLQPAAQRVVGAIDAVGGHPGEGHTGRVRPLEHRQAELGLGGERDLLGHAGLGPARPVRRPAFRQIERTVDQGPAVAAGIGQEHADLAVLDPPRRAAVLPLHARRLAALLEKAGLVQDQHAARIAQMLGHIGPQIVADRVRVPAHPAQELLHPVRRPVPGRLRQLPAVLALHRRQQPLADRPPPAAAARPARTAAPAVPARPRTPPTTPQPSSIIAMASPPSRRRLA